MRYAVQWLRSLVFIGLMYLAMLPYAIFYAPWAILSRKGAVAAAHGWCRAVMWLARWVIGLDCQVRGTPPTGEVLIAAKHQSFLDIIMLYAALPHAKFIMKKQLVYTPILGQYALRLGCIPVDRGKRGQAIKQMLASVAAGKADPGQLVIYPQGTRIAPGVKASYKIGTGALYAELGQPCVPVACNVGVFWPRHGIHRKPGVAIIQFLDPIPPGLPLPAFMAQVEAVVEAQSNTLMAEAGFLGAPVRIT
jgi:1-acyl-sn-glycerol-3-phosphate acyltransferase